MTWTRDEIIHRVVADTDALMQRHKHWLDLDRVTVLELLAELARSGPDFYHAQHRLLQDMMYEVEAKHLGRTTH